MVCSGDRVWVIVASFGRECSVPSGGGLSIPDSPVINYGPDWKPALCLTAEHLVHTIRYQTNGVWKSVRTLNKNAKSLLGVVLLLLAASLFGCESQAERQSTAILNAHKSGYQVCAREAHELHQLALQPVPESIVELRIQSARMKSARRAFENNRCLENWLSTVDAERAEAGIDQAVFNEMKMNALRRWDEEWGYTIE